MGSGTHLVKAVAHAGDTEHRAGKAAGYELWGGGMKPAGRWSAGMAAAGCMAPTNLPPSRSTRSTAHVRPPCLACPRQQHSGSAMSHMHAGGAPVVSLTSRGPRREAEMRTVMLLPPEA